jgi:penicillin G amidase
LRRRECYLETGRLPVEFAMLRYQPEPWQPVDSLSWVKVLNWFLSGNWECELLRYQLIQKLGVDTAMQLELSAEEAWPIVLDIPDLLGLKKHLSQLARPYTGPGPGEGVGSNNWVFRAAELRPASPCWRMICTCR